MGKVKDLLLEIDEAEDAASEASARLQRARENLIAIASPVQRTEEATWTIDEKDVRVYVFNVQVAKHGRHGHKIVAYGNPIINGVRSADRVEVEFPLDDNGVINGNKDKRSKK